MDSGLGLDMEINDDITLVSCDEAEPRTFSIERKAALLCNLIKSILEGDSDVSKIEVKKVSGSVLEHVVGYLKHHNGKAPAEIAKPIRSVKMAKIVEDGWDAKFIDGMEKKTVFEIILAANYMDIRSLLHLGCAKIATLIKGKSPEEIKKILSEEDGPDAK